MLRQFKCVQNGKTMYCILVIQIISTEIEVTSYNYCHITKTIQRRRVRQKVHVTGC